MIFICILLFSGCSQDRYRIDLPEINSSKIKFAPEYIKENPGLPSPALSEKGRELVLINLNNDRYTWVDATVENGEPFDYKKNLHGKGNQLLADAEDFPCLAHRGTHSREELKNAKLITGRSVSQITLDGRPSASSGVGFMADDETVMSVIRADNETVKNMGLTHPDVCRPLFHLWNISREWENLNKSKATGERGEPESLNYNGLKVKFKITGSRGWQESIFHDEILGTGLIEIWREMNDPELAFIREKYGHLSKDQQEKLQKMLSFIHTGEMVFFYINRYGFYEGHTEYRVDPVTAAFVFGLRSIEELHKLCRNDLLTYFTTHFTINPE